MLYLFRMKKKPSLPKEALQFLSFCPVCETRESGVDVRSLGVDGEVRLWYVQCRICSHALLSMVIERGEQVSSIGIVTDLSIDDLYRVKHQKSVTIDDVLLTHETFAKSEVMQGLLHRGKKLS